jgi:5-(carboxyamino)imidazole ribonucleotide mutase
MQQVAILMGSDSDWRIMKKAKDVLDSFGISSVCKVISAHRTPEDLSPFIKDAEKAGTQVIIAGAGGAAHLPGVVAAYTHLPVIGIPINATPLNGMDALLSIVQMPEGIPVATMGIENAGNAAIFAAKVLALSDAGLKDKLLSFREDMANKSRKKTENLK